MGLLAYISAKIPAKVVLQVSFMTITLMCIIFAMCDFVHYLTWAASSQIIQDESGAKSGNCLGFYVSCRLRFQFLSTSSRQACFLLGSCRALQKKEHSTLSVTMTN